MRGREPGNRFVAGSPYHLFLSCGIALGLGEPVNNRLFIISGFDGIDRLRTNGVRHQHRGSGTDA